MVKEKFSDTLRMLKFWVSSDDKEQKENLDYLICVSQEKGPVLFAFCYLLSSLGRQVRATVEGSQGGCSRPEPGGRN